MPESLDGPRSLVPAPVVDSGPRPDHPFPPLMFDPDPGFTPPVTGVSYHGPREWSQSFPSVTVAQVSGSKCTQGRVDRGGFWGDPSVSQGDSEGR